MTAKAPIIAFAIAFAFLTPAACATVVLDQDAKVQLVDNSTFASSNSVWSGLDGWDTLETFTAGKTGQLVTIALQTYQVPGTSGPATFDLSIYQGNGAELGSSAVGSVSFTNTQSESSYNSGGMVKIDMASLGFNVTAGTIYSYSISTEHDTGDQCCTGRLLLPIGITLADGTLIKNDYAGGRDYRRTWTDGTTPGWDLSENFAVVRGFQTYVDVSAVPELSQWAMLIFGLGIITSLNRVCVRSQKP